MTNTINNVPRELLERASNLAFQTQHYPLHEELRTLLSAPSPDGVDGLEVVGWYRMDGRKDITPYPSVCATWHKMGVKVGAAYSDSAHAIIDGLRGELAVALKVPSVAAMHTYLDTECAKDNIRLGAERDQQAQRIGELEWLLREIGNRCEQRDMPGEQIIAEWSDQIDAALYSR